MAPVALLLFVAPLLIGSKAQKPVDCSDIAEQNRLSLSKVYTIYPVDERYGVPVYCDMDSDRGYWTVIQRRMNGSLNFYRPWDQYVAGFGNADGEYWLGLEFIHKITTRQPQELLVEMEDFEGNKVSAHYSSFLVKPECEGYELQVSGFTDGGAGDSLTEHNGMKFSTFDHDQDANGDNCAKVYTGAFWYLSCHYSNPNGAYLWGAGTTFGCGVIWYTWKGHEYSLKKISFKIRPVGI